MSALPIEALPRPAARWWDRMRVAGAALGALCGAFLRRLIGRSVHPKWPFKMELVIAATRGAWSVMPAIGMIGALARSARAHALALEYRLAPEHPSPAAVTDAVTAYRAVPSLRCSYP